MVGGSAEAEVLRVLPSAGEVVPTGETVPGCGGAAVSGGLEAVTAAAAVRCVRVQPAALTVWRGYGVLACAAADSGHRRSAAHASDSGAHHRRARRRPRSAERLCGNHTAGRHRRQWRPRCHRSDLRRRRSCRTKPGRPLCDRWKPGLLGLSLSAASLRVTIDDVPRCSDCTILRAAAVATAEPRFSYRGALPFKSPAAANGHGTDPPRITRPRPSLRQCGGPSPRQSIGGAERPCEPNPLCLPSDCRRCPVQSTQCAVIAVCYSRTALCTSALYRNAVVTECCVLCSLGLAGSIGRRRAHHPGEHPSSALIATMRHHGGQCSSAPALPGLLSSTEPAVHAHRPESGLCSAGNQHRTTQRCWHHNSVHPITYRKWITTTRGITEC